MRDICAEEMWQFLRANAGSLRKIWLSTGKCKYPITDEEADIDYFDDSDDTDNSEEQNITAKSNK